MKLVVWIAVLFLSVSSSYALDVACETKVVQDSTVTIGHRLSADAPKVFEDPKDRMHYTVPFVRGYWTNSKELHTIQFELPEEKETGIPYPLKVENDLEYQVSLVRVHDYVGEVNQDTVRLYVSGNANRAYTHFEALGYSDISAESLKAGNKLVLSVPIYRRTIREAIKEEVLKPARKSLLVSCAALD